MRPNSSGRPATKDNRRSLKINSRRPARTKEMPDCFRSLNSAFFWPANDANATGGGFQIQELSIKFSGVQETLNQSGANGQAGNTSVQLSAFNLQVEEVNLTLANGNGQTAQIQAPQPAAALPGLNTTPKVTAPLAAQVNAATA